MSERVVHVAGCPQEADARNVSCWCDEIERKDHARQERDLQIREAHMEHKREADARCAIQAIMRHTCIGADFEQFATRLGSELYQEHRTNQQQIVALLAMALVWYGTLCQEHGTDLRNETAAKFAQRLAGLLREMGLERGFPYL